MHSRGVSGTTFAKRPIVDVWQDPKYASVYNRDPAVENMFKINNKILGTMWPTLNKSHTFSGRHFDFFNMVFSRGK